MSSELTKRLQSLRSTERRIKPDAAWVQATRKTLLMQAANSMPTQKASVIESTRHAVKHFFVANIAGALRKPAMAIVSILAVIGGGSLMSVSAAERSLPGDFLYGLKLATEQAQLALTSSKPEKLKLKTEFTTRRVSELKQVAAAAKDHSAPPDSGDRVKQVAEILKSDLNTLKDQLGDVKQESSSDVTAAAAKLVDQKTNEVIAALQETKVDSAPDVKAAVTDAQSAAADTSVKAIEVLVEKHQESSEIVPVEDVAQAIQNHANAVASATQDLTAPLELVSSTSSTVTASTTAVVALMQSLVTTSTMTVASTTEILPTIVDQVKDITTQAFTMQKEKDQKEIQNANAQTDATSATSTSTTQDGAPAPTASSTKPSS